MNNITINYNGKSYDYQEDTTLLDISKDFADDFENRIIIGEINGRLCELSDKVRESSTIKFYDYTSSIGNKVYESGLIFVLAKAFKDIFKADIEVKYSIDKGIYICTNKRLTVDSLSKVEEEMKSIIKKDLVIEKSLVSRLDAIKYYEEAGYLDKCKILKYTVNTNVSLYRLSDMYDYFFSYLPVSTGYLKDFKITFIDSHSFVLGYPNVYSKGKMPNYKHHDKLFNEFKKYDEWCKSLDIQNVSGLNKRVSKGNIDDLILLSENMQNHNLLNIAEKIRDNKNIKLILMAGPSSSGKTTSSKKLELFLQGFGFKPRAISVDDYFVDREKTPKLEDGSYDFESLNAVDVGSFNKDLKNLLDGKAVKLPTYNFISGKREYNDEPVTLDDNEILIIEGLHALNEKLTGSIDKKNKYKIYLSPLTVLNLDNHNRIKTSDNRLLRRIIRDNRTRGYSASDTLESWSKVREGEEKYIFPFQDEADIVFNTSLIYEIGVIKTYAEPLLFSVKEDDPNYKEAVRLLNLLRNILPISNDNIPKDSILREFIGDGYFRV